MTKKYVAWFLGLSGWAMLVGCGPEDAEPSCPEGTTASEGRCLGPGCTDGIDSDEDGFCDRENADWSADAVVEPGTHRADIYRLEGDLPQMATLGIGHSMVWPVEVSGMLLPWQAFQNLLDPTTESMSVMTAQKFARSELGFGTTDEMHAFLGLARVDDDGEAWDGVAWPESASPGEYMGTGAIETEWGEALTFSCATCHVAEFFGHTVVGMTNRKAQANEFLHSATQFFPRVTPALFRSLTGATDAELELVARTQANLRSVEIELPLVRGLDTSLAQVGLSLSRREADAWATKSAELEEEPRANDLRTEAADSKPAVWWTLRYKTRWLADGSVVSGNPIYTNFLWNEIGRGTDLEELEGWLADNHHVVDELTVAAFASEAPRWHEIFPDRPIDVEAAQRGEETFVQMCASCHGTYEKGWSAGDAADRDGPALTETVRVVYHQQTPVYDVGTSPLRARGMRHFADRLNELTISQYADTVIEVQDGYVAPPLDGVFARYPYLHNQSVPTLCDLLSPSDQRAKVFFMGPDEDPDTDYDFDCVGLPVGEAIPESWKEDPRNEFDTSRSGLSNGGHDEWLVDADGNPVLSGAERRDLIEFLKTL